MRISHGSAEGSSMARGVGSKMCHPGCCLEVKAMDAPQREWNAPGAMLARERLL